MAVPSTVAGTTHAALDTQFFEAVFVMSKINNCADICERCCSKVIGALVKVNSDPRTPDIFGVSQASNPGVHIRTVATLEGGIAIGTTDSPALRSVKVGALLKSHFDPSWMPRVIDRWVGWLTPPGAPVDAGWTEVQAKLWLALGGFYDQGDVVRSRDLRPFLAGHKAVLDRSARSATQGCGCNVGKFAARLGHYRGKSWAHQSACVALWAAEHLPAAVRDAVGKIPSGTGSPDGIPDPTAWLLQRWTSPEVRFALLSERRPAGFYANIKAVDWSKVWVGAPIGFVEPLQSRTSGVELLDQLQAALSLLPPWETAWTEEEPVLTLK